MDYVVFNVRSKVTPDGSFIRLLGIRSSHQIPVSLNYLFSLQDQTTIIPLAMKFTRLSKKLRSRWAE